MDGKKTNYLIVFTTNHYSQFPGIVIEEKSLLHSPKVKNNFFFICKEAFGD